MSKNVKNKPIIWSFEAKNNLERIFDHIEENFSFELAVKIADSLMEEVESLSQFPRKGKISELFNEMRELIVESNTIYYRNNESDILITSIRPRKTKSSLT